GQISDIISATEIPLDKLSVWGILTTKRYEKQTSIGIMALDENDYVGQKDYELEDEVTDPDAGKILFDEFLKKYSIPF
ncbi:CYTH domain-containing protein, partial [Streptococcus suis]